MEDGYKELIEKLHNIGDVGDTPIGKHWSALIDKSTLRDVIDVIERLARERDDKAADYEILAKMYAKVNKDLCVRTKERDAAIKDLKYLPFTTCKWVNTDRCKNSCLCERYEWRGVQE